MIPLLPWLLLAGCSPGTKPPDDSAAADSGDPGDSGESGESDDSGESGDSGDTGAAPTDPLQPARTTAVYNLDASNDASIAGLHTLAFTGDLDGDGASDLLGAYGDGAEDLVILPRALVGEVDPYNFSRMSSPLDDISSLEGDDDLTGEGWPDILITATDSSNPIDCGACVGFGPYGASVAWTPDAFAVGSDGRNLEGFARTADVDGDGVGDLLAVTYVSGTMGFATFLGPLSPGELDTAAADGFSSVSYRWIEDGGLSISDDVNVDGYPDLLVGFTGAVESYAGPPEGRLALGPITRLTDLDTQAVATFTPQPEDADPAGIGTAFGGNVAFVGDMDGDGTRDLAISASYAEAFPERHLGDPTGAAGAVYIFSGDSSGVVSAADASARLFGPDNVDTPGAGWGMTPAGDSDGDGLGELWIFDPYIGAHGEEFSGIFQVRGPVYGSGTLDTADVYIQSDPHELVMTTSYALLLAGDASGDGVSDLLISAGQWILDGPF